MKKLVISLITILAASTTLMAQNEVDALRFSRLMYGGFGSLYELRRRLWRCWR